jgi:hypothetical protein
LDDDACVRTPSVASCSGFVYPDANSTADLAKLCSMVRTSSLPLPLLLVVSFFLLPVIASWTVFLRPCGFAPC